MTRYGDVRQGGILRGKLVVARLKIVKNRLVPCLSSLPEVPKNDFELYHERSEQSNRSNPSKVEETTLNTCRSVCGGSIVFDVRVDNVSLERHQV